MSAGKSSFFFLLLYTGITFATPPTPPATVRVDETALIAHRSVLPVRIDTDAVIRESRLQVSVQALPVGIPQFARPARSVIFDQRSVAQASRTLDIPLIGLAPGEYELDIMLSGSEDDSQGFAHRALNHLTLTAEGAIRVESMDALALREDSQRLQAFQSALARNPGQPQIRLLMGGVVAVPSAIAASVAGRDVPENLRGLVQPAEPAADLRPYYRERVQSAAAAADSLEVRGRLIFLDIDGVWRPIVNATVQLWDDEFSGADLLGIALSDGQGNWSFSVDNQDGPAEGGRDLFFTAELANSRVRLTQCAGRYRWSSTVRSNLPDGAIVDFGPSTTEGGYGAVRVFDVLHRAWGHTTAVGGQDPGRVDACYPKEHTRTSFEGRIDIAAEDFDSDNIAHEYGHILMLRATGSHSPGGPHSFNDCDLDPALAWSEGWANGFALAVIPDGVYNFHSLSPGGSDKNLEFAASWFSCYQGARNEARIAAALNDMLDAPDDDNGGSSFAGREGYGDNNAQARISLASMFRDTLWGRPAHDDVLSFWNALSNAITPQRRELGYEILYFNYMPVPEPDACVAAQVSQASLPDARPTLAGLRAFRDRVLESATGGQQLIDSYYRHSSEMASLLVRNPRSIPDALRVIQHFAALGDLVADPERYQRALAARQVVVSAEVSQSIERLLDLFVTRGGAALAADTRVAAQAFATARSLTLPPDLLVRSLDASLRQGRRIDCADGACDRILAALLEHRRCIAGRHVVARMPPRIAAAGAVGCLLDPAKQGLDIRPPRQIEIRVRDAHASHQLSSLPTAMWRARPE